MKLKKLSIYYIILQHINSFQFLIAIYQQTLIIQIKESLKKAEFLR